MQDLLAKAKKEKQISGREQQKNMAAQKQREEAEALAEQKRALEMANPRVKR